MSYVLNKLESKKEVDNAIRCTEDKVLVLRFGTESDQECMRLDDIVSYTVKMAKHEHPG
jgi:hypothetical protein